MNPVIYIVGRTNVGKSRLLNRLTKISKVLVKEHDNLTRDRIQVKTYSNSNLEYELVDTGGVDFSEKEGIPKLVLEQVKLGLNEADLSLLVVDGIHGLHPRDYEIAQYLRANNIPTLLVVNKSESVDKSILAADFFALGLGNPMMISAIRGEGISKLLEYIDDLCKKYVYTKPEDQSKPVRVVVFGRANVGKSNFINSYLRINRLIVSNIKGTTRDAVKLESKYKDRRIILVDTAGVEKKLFSNIEEEFRKAAYRSVMDADTVIYLIDSCMGLTDQDKRLISYVSNLGRSICLGITKVDLVDKKSRVNISSYGMIAKNTEYLHINTNRYRDVFRLVGYALKAYDSSNVNLQTSKILSCIKEAVNLRTPAAVLNNVYPKLKHAHQIAKTPIKILVYGKRLDLINNTYKRYLENYLSSNFNVVGSKIKIEFKAESADEHR